MATEPDTTNPPEEWRALRHVSPPELCSAYEVSNMGRVRSVDRLIPSRWGLARTRGQMLRLKINDGGYLTIEMSYVRRRRNIAVHTLVLRAFVGLPEKGQVCRHLNGNRLDARLSNLAYGTHKENVADMHRHRRAAVGSANGSAKVTEAQVRTIRDDRANGMSLRAIARRHLISHSAAYNICAGITWAVNGRAPDDAREAGRIEGFADGIEAAAKIADRYGKHRTALAIRGLVGSKP
jgi:hypothetical protein